MPQRTTLTLEDAVAKALKDQAREQGIPVKQLANAALKAGLLALKVGAGAKPYTLTPQSLGRTVQNVNLDKALALSDKLENAELIQKSLKG